MSASVQRNSNSNKIDLKIHGHNNCFAISRKSVEIVCFAEDSITIRIPVGCNNNEGVAIRRFTKFETSNGLKDNRSNSTIELSSSASSSCNMAVANDDKKKKIKILEVIKPNNTAQLNTGDVLVFDHFAKRSRYQFKLIVGSAQDDVSSQKKIMGRTSGSAKRRVIDMLTDDDMEIIPNHHKVKDDHLDDKAGSSRTRVVRDVVSVSVSRNEENSNDVIEILEESPSNIARHSSLIQQVKSSTPTRKKAKYIHQQVVNLRDDDPDAVEIVNPYKKNDMVRKKITAAKIATDILPVFSPSTSTSSSSDVPIVTNVFPGNCNYTASATVRELSIGIDLVSNCGTVSDDSGSMSDVIQSPNTGETKPTLCMAIKDDECLTNDAQVYHECSSSSSEQLKYETKDSPPKAVDRKSELATVAGVLEPSPSATDAIDHAKNENVCNEEKKPPPRPRRSNRILTAGGDGVKAVPAVARASVVQKKENKQKLAETLRRVKEPPTTQDSTNNGVLKHPGNIVLKPHCPEMKKLVLKITTSTDAEPTAIHQAVVNTLHRSLMSSEPGIGKQFLMSQLACGNQVPPEDVLGDIFRAALFGPKCDGVKFVDLNKHQLVIGYVKKLVHQLSSHWDWTLFVDIITVPLNTDTVDVWEQSAQTFEFIADLFTKNEQVLDTCPDVRGMMKQTIIALNSFYAGREEVFASSFTEEKLEVINSVTRLCKAYCNVAAPLAHFLKRIEDSSEQEMLYQCLAGVDPECDLFVIFEDILLC